MYLGQAGGWLYSVSSARKEKTLPPARVPEEFIFFRAWSIYPRGKKEALYS